MAEPRRDRVSSRSHWRYWPNTPIPYDLSAEAASLRELSHHPELEDYENIAWGFAQNEIDKEDNVVIDVLDVKEKIVRWRESIRDEELQSVIEVGWAV